MSVLLSQDLTTTASVQDSIAVTRPVISFILPIYNGGSTAASRISNWIRATSDILPKFEIIMVDDGSIDDTYEALKRINNPALKIVRMDVNQGKGAALKFGFGFATADIVVFADGDLQALPSNFDEFIISMKKSQIAIASKRVVGSRVEADTKRKLLSIGFNCIVRMLVSLPLVDTQAGFKVFKRSALEKIIPLISVKHYAFDVELLVIAHLLEMEIVELPASVKLESSFRVRNILRMFVDVLGIAYRLRIRRWYQNNLDGQVSPYRPFLDLR
jgi:glycosyltransferase involved in cell wall biosynthesis